MVGLSSTQPDLLVGLTNVLGEAIKQVQFSVEAQSGKSQKASDANLVPAKKPFTAKSSDG